MNRISTLITALVLSASTAQAQWVPDDKAYTVIGKDSIYGQSGLKTLRTDDGKIVLTWLNHPTDVSYKDPNYGYHLYMQTFDKDGHPLLGKEGKVIVGRSTRSWYTDYSLEMTPDGNILISYSDTRNDPDKQNVGNYLYCYTTEGEPVWSEDGIAAAAVFPTLDGHAYSSLCPLLCVSGKNLYGTIVANDDYKVKADSTNWQPSPWYPDEEMPDSIDVHDANFQVMRYNADGTYAWADTKTINTGSAWAYPGPDGGLYIVYVNGGYGLSAILIDQDGNDVWKEPVCVVKETVGTSSYTTPPTVVPDDSGGLMLTYRVLKNYGGYVACNHISRDGKVYEESLLANGTTDGDSNSPAIAVNGERAFVAFNYKDETSTPNLWINQLDIDGDYTWEGDSLLGYSLDNNESWGLQPVKIIPQSDGWVLLYGNLQSWNGANFYVSKIDFEGKELWRKQIAESDFKSSGFSVVNDDKYVYIFYTCDMEIGDDWEQIPGEGGMRVMCVDISNVETGINSLNSNPTKTSRAIYNAQGVLVDNMNDAGLYIVRENGTTRKIMKK